MPTIAFSILNLVRAAALIATLAAVAHTATGLAEEPALTATPLVLEVGESSVRVSNVTPGGDLVLFSCAKVARKGAAFSETLPRLLRDDDGDGVVILDGPVPIVSVWIAVDWRTGVVGTGARDGFPVYVATISPALYRKDAENQIAALEKRIPRLMLLLVRPEKGAWVLRVREGGEGDRDNEANGRLLLAFEDAKPIPGGKEKAPRHLNAGDVVIAVDLGHLDIFVGEVTK